MRLQLITVGHKMPSWVYDVSKEYIKRFGQDLKFQIDEISPPHRGKNPDIPRLMDEEAKLILAKQLKGSILVTLDVKGKTLSTENLSTQLEIWMQSGRDVSFIIGGADGIAPSILTKADASISLSKMTFPHPLARVVTIEQLYRAYSIIHNHPYHRF